jgi:hypothetical protein
MSNNNNLLNNSNSSFNLSKGNNRIYKGDTGNLVLICLIAFLILILIFIGIMVSIYLKAYNQNKIQNHMEEELLEYIHDCKDNFKVIDGSKIPASTLANEYSLNFWIYINNVDYRDSFNKQILMRGDPENYQNEEYPKSNPNIFIKKNSNDMVLLFEGENQFGSDNFSGCYRLIDLFNNMEIKIQDDISYLKFNSNRIDRGNQANQGSKFKLVHEDVLVSGDRKVRFFKIHIDSGSGNYTEIRAGVGNGNLNNEILINDSGGKTIHFEIENPEIGFFRLKAHVDRDSPTTKKIRYLKFDSSNNKYKLVTENTARFKFHPETLSGIEEETTSAAKSNNFSSNDCKEKTLSKGIEFSHFGMYEPNQGRTAALCKPLTATDFNSDLVKVDRTFCQGDDLGSKNYMSVSRARGFSDGRVEIKNIPIQRWTCFNISVHDRVVDVYKDGLLYHTEILNNPPRINDYPIIIANNGGFDGYLSRITWSNKALTPAEIYKKYTQGPRITLTLGDRLRGLISSDSKQ